MNQSKTEDATVKDVADLCEKLNLKIVAMQKRGTCFTVTLSRDGDRKMGESQELCEAFHRAIEQYRFLTPQVDSCS